MEEVSALQGVFDFFSGGSVYKKALAEAAAACPVSRLGDASWTRKNRRSRHGDTHGGKVWKMEDT